jgi:hypothetical protein
MRKMLASQELDDHETLRLILVAQSSMLDRQIEMAKTLEKIEQAQRAYPSILWLIAHQPKRAATHLFLIFFFLYILFAPITISDARHALLGWLGFQ